MHRFNGWDGHKGKKIKQVYHLEISVEKKRDTFLLATLEVKTFFTIATQNKALRGFHEIHRMVSSK